MKNELIRLLETFNYPVYLQGSLSENDAYPDSFFTFWNNETYDNNHYDNQAASYTWNFDVNFYSVDPGLVNSMLLGAKALLKQNGWIVGGKGYDVVSDEPTHTGRGINVLYFEREG